MSQELYIPSRCTAKIPDDLTKPYFVAEEKMDGSRYVLYIGCDPYGRQRGNTMLSRRVSVVDNKHVDRTANVPHITAIDYGSLEGTVLDGEIMSADFLGTNSIMNSAPALAIEKQNESGLLNYFVFDVMAFRGKDVRGLPLHQRRKILEEVVKRMGVPQVIPIKQVTTDLEGYFREIVEKGGEGIIVKDTRQGYGMGWSKWKRTTDVSCIVTGWKPGNGKYAKMIGSIALSAYKDGGLIEIGFASGFDDRLRGEMSRDFESYRGRVVDVFAQEIQKVGTPRLRHPTFHRFRDDVEPETCTLEKIISDMKTKIRGDREKES